MKYPQYPCLSDDTRLFFKFFSEGPKGRIVKLVEYTPTSNSNVFNLGFGDYDEATDSINDFSVTNNGDSLKVLATVASTVYAFTDKYPGAWIVATGSTVARSRLYRMGIANNLAEIRNDFTVFGFNTSEIWEEFVIDRNYEIFLVTKKNNKFAL